MAVFILLWNWLTTENKNGLLIAGDNDKLAVNYLKENFPSLQVIQKNALINPKRAEYSIQSKQKLIIIGNPPYNDLTSLKARKIKENFPNHLTIDPSIKSRDLGISFLRSYYHLEADYVCVLHPLSYLIKETNFNHLKEFKDNYRLLKSLIVDSKKFTDAKGASFPIAISLYKLDKKGMSYEYIRNFSFRLEDGREFSLNSFQFLTNLIDKYPKKTLSNEHLNNLFFFTFRDINSIMRNKTFIQEFNHYSVPIKKDQLKYYAYIDYFKEKFHDSIPFYLRNSDVFYDPNFQEEDWKYFVNRVSAKMKQKEPQKIISYDLKEKKSNFDELYQETFNKIKIVDSEKKPTGRCIYELSDLLIEILKKGFIDFQHLSKLLEEVKQEKKFIEDELKVVRNFPKDKVYKFGKYEFLRGIIEHPLLIYEVNGLALKIEIIIKDRQKAAGIQPMLYLCIPSELVEEFLEIKGGVGKSTLSQALATEASQQELKTLLADYDPQQKTTKQKNKYLTVNSFTTFKEIIKQGKDFDLIIIDGPARTSAGTLEIARQANLVIQPTGASLADLKPSVNEFHSLVKAGINKKKLVFVLNHLATKSEEGAAREYLTMAGYSILNHSLKEKASYRLIQNEGKSISEVSYKSLQKEAKELVKEIIKIPPSLSETTSHLQLPEVIGGKVDKRTLRKTGRTEQFATRVIRGIAEKENLKLVEVLEKLLEHYEKKPTKEAVKENFSFNSEISSTREKNLAELADDSEQFFNTCSFYLEENATLCDKPLFDKKKQLCRSHNKQNERKTKFCRRLKMKKMNKKPTPEEKNRNKELVRFYQAQIFKLTRQQKYLLTQLDKIQAQIKDYEKEKKKVEK
ncbi:39501_t:CDS:2 [Gigaspora margarita]|uniref:39501_t:CDS:1 n=1 Tax=Gigaspora margarita TaxID=4874 RepID=A0ABM8VWE1_GIGMA|nr:39501_t:CDS:2 [Gigaspora margarita]